MFNIFSYIGLLTSILFIIVGIPLIIWIITNINNNDSEKALFRTFITINTALAIILSAWLFKFINNPEQFGYEKIQTEQTIEVNENDLR